MRPHDVEWTPAKVEALWDDYATRLPDRRYFSGLLAPALAAWIARHAKPRRSLPLLDLGCGGGHLLGEMAKRGYRPFGIDLSPASLEVAAARIGRANVASGSVTSIPLESGAVGGVLLVETIEHVLDADLDPMMQEIRRVLSADAPLVITTPNGEDLVAAMVSCPDCGARFHPFQHVRSWTAEALATFLRASGFGRVRTYELNLAAGRGPIVVARRVLYRVRGDRPLLFAVARV